MNLTNLNDKKSQIKEISINDMMATVVNRAKIYMKHEMKLDYDKDSPEVVRTDKPFIKDFTALINLKGMVRGTFAMSFDEGLARCLVRKFAYDELTESEEEEYIEDTLGEILNIVLGNATNNYSAFKGVLIFEAPVAIKTRDAKIKFIGSNMLTSNINTKFGDFSINIIV